MTRLTLRPAGWNSGGSGIHNKTVIRYIVHGLSGNDHVTIDGISTAKDMTWTIHDNGMRIGHQHASAEAARAALEAGQP